MTVEFEDVPEAEKDTAKALLCVINGKAVWVPKSQIHDDSEVYKVGTSGTLIVSDWWAEQAGLV